MTRQQLARLNYNDARKAHDHGTISSEDWLWYRHLWRNSAPRLSETAQDQAHADEAARQACQTCQDAREMLQQIRLENEKTRRLFPAHRS